MSDLLKRLVDLYHLRFVPTVKRMCARRRLAYTLLTVGILCISAATLSMLVFHGAGLLELYAEMLEEFLAFRAESHISVDLLPDMEQILASSKAASVVAACMGALVWLVLSVTAVGRIMTSVIESEAYIYGLYMIYGSGQKQLRRQLSTEFMLEGVAALMVGIPLGYALLPNRGGFGAVGLLVIFVGFLLLIFLSANILAKSILGRSCVRMLNAADTSDYTVSPRRSNLAGLKGKPRGSLAAAALAVWRMRKHYASLAVVVAVISALIFSMLSTEGQVVSVPAPAFTVRFADGVDARTLEQDYLSYLHPSSAISRMDYRISGTAESLGSHVLVNEALAGAPEESIRLGERYATSSFRIACGDGETYNELGGQVSIPREFWGKELTDPGYELEPVPVGKATYVYPEGTTPPLSLSVGDRVQLYLPSEDGVGSMTDRVENDRDYITVTINKVVEVGSILVEGTREEVCPRITEDYLYLNPLEYGLFDGKTHAMSFVAEEVYSSDLFENADESTCILVVPEGGGSLARIPSHITVITPTEPVKVAFHDGEHTLPDDTYFVNLTFRGTGIYLGSENDFNADEDAMDELTKYIRESLKPYKESPTTPTTRIQYRVDKVIYTGQGGAPYLLLPRTPEVTYSSMQNDICAFRLADVSGKTPYLQKIAEEAFLVETDMLFGASFFGRSACIGTFLMPHFAETMKAHRVNLQFPEGWFAQTYTVIRSSFSRDKRNYLLADPYTDDEYELGYLQAEEYPVAVSGTGSFVPLGNIKEPSILTASDIGAFGLFAGSSIGTRKDESETIESLYARNDWTLTPSCETSPSVDLAPGHGILITDGDPHACPLRVGDTVSVAIRADTSPLLRDPEIMGLEGTPLLAFLLDRIYYHYMLITVDEIRQGESAGLILSETDMAAVLDKDGVYENLDIYLSPDTSMTEYLQCYADVMNLTREEGSNATVSMDRDYMVDAQVSAEHDSRVLRQIGYLAVCMIPLLLLAAEMVFYEKREEEFDIFDTIGHTPRRRRRRFAAEWGITACILGLFTAVTCPLGYILTLILADKAGATIPFSSFDPILYSQMLQPVLISCLAAGLVTYLRIGQSDPRSVSYRRRKTPHLPKEAQNHHESSGM